LSELITLHNIELLVINKDVEATSLTVLQSHTI